MIGMVSFKYAFRSMTRHHRRSILSVIGIGLGCGVCLFMISFARGEGEMMMRAAAESGAGHLRIVPDKWPDTHDNRLRLPDGKRLLEQVRKIPGVKLACPRARAQALIAFGNRMTGLELTGVDATVENKGNRTVHNIIAGRYLKPDDENGVVIGKTTATRFKVEPGDQLMVTAAGKNGEMVSAMLHIIGVAATGSRDIDALTCQVPLESFQKITGIDGIGEITIFARDSRDLDTLEARITPLLPKGSCIVRWDSIVPELASGVKIDQTWSRLMVGLVIIVVFCGIASAQLAASLERRKEFAVLAAIGMKSFHLGMIVILEGFFLGLLGTCFGLLTGIPFVYLSHLYGINFSFLTQDVEMSMSNVLFEPIIYGDFGWWLIPVAFYICMVASILGSLYPAWFAIRTNPAQALRVEQ